MENTYKIDAHAYLGHAKNDFVAERYNLGSHICRRGCNILYNGGWSDASMYLLYALPFYSNRRAKFSALDLGPFLCNAGDFVVIFFLFTKCTCAHL